MTNITQNINHVRQMLAKYAAAAGRSVDDITLLAVSKTQGPEKIREAWEAGIRQFGENYLQEAQAKIEALQGLDIEWHFIGPVQSNKTRPIAEQFHWVHAVDRTKIAQRLSAQRPPGAPPLNICLQVNLDNEPTKSGVAPEQLASLAQAVVNLPNLKLRGLMAIPEAASNREQQQLSFFRLARLLDTLKTLSPALAAMDTLSMGMSGDMEAAIEEGSTLLRVGTAIFGKRASVPARP